MQKLELLGEEVWLCPDKTAREVFAAAPEGDRWRIWSGAEWLAHIERGPEEVGKVMSAKKRTPGKYLTVPE